MLTRQPFHTTTHRRLSLPCCTAIVPCYNIGYTRVASSHAIRKALDFNNGFEARIAGSARHRTECHLRLCRSSKFKDHERCASKHSKSTRCLFTGGHRYQFSRPRPHLRLIMLSDIPKRRAHCWRTRRCRGHGEGGR